MFSLTIKITSEQSSDEGCSNVISLVLKRLFFCLLGYINLVPSASSLSFLSKILNVERSRGDEVEDMGLSA